MASEKIFSKKFEKEFDIEYIVLNDGTKMPTYQGLVALIESLGDTVRIEHKYVPAAPVFMWETIIEDDAGAKVDEIGSVNIQEETDKIALKRPAETAKSRAFRVAISKYFGFPEKLEKADVTPAETTEDIIVDEEYVEVDEVPAEEPAKYQPKKKTKKDEEAEDPGEFTVTFGASMKGKKIKELPEKTVKWLASEEFDPRNNAAGKAAKKAATEYLAAK